MLIITTLLSSYTSMAQKDTMRLYLDAGEKLTSSGLAKYYRVAYRQDGMWFSTDYYMGSGSVAAEAAYLDDSLLLRTGSYSSYYEDGKKKERFRYTKGQKNGMQREYYKSGLTKDSGWYKMGIPVSTIYAWAEDGELNFKGTYDSTGTGVGFDTSYFAKGIISSYGRYSEGHKEDSIWTYYRQDGSISFMAYYDKGDSVKSECYNEKGLLQDGPCYARVMPDPGYDVSDYISNNVSFPKGYTFSRDGKARVIIKFQIDEEGNVHDAVVIQSLHSAFDEPALEAIKKMPRWKIPAMEYNRKASIYFTLPVAYVY